MKYLKSHYVVLISLLFLISCNKSDPTDIHSDDFVPIWENIINNESPTSNGINIGIKYLGVRNWSALSDPPYIFVGATFPESSFANSFDREVTARKNSAYLFFNFPDPYIGNMDMPQGVEYLKVLKEALKSDEYKSFKNPSRPYKFRLANLGSLSYVEKLFPENKRFANALEQLCRQTLKMEHVNSLSLGEIVFKGSLYRWIYQVKVYSPRHLPI